MPFFKLATLLQCTMRATCNLDSWHLNSCCMPLSSSRAGLQANVEELESQMQRASAQLSALQQRTSAPVSMAC